MADGWHAVHIPAGQGGCPPLGHGILTLYESGTRGGRDAAVEVALEGGEIFRRYAWKERCLMLCLAW